MPLIEWPMLTGQLEPVRKTRQRKSAKSLGYKSQFSNNEAVMSFLEKQKIPKRPLSIIVLSVALLLTQSAIADAFWWRSLDCSKSDAVDEVADRIKSYFNSKVILIDGSDTAELLSVYLRNVPSRIDVVSTKTLHSNDEFQECELIGHLTIDRRDARTIAGLAADDPILHPRLETPEGRSLFSAFLKITTGGFYGRVEYRITPNADGSIKTEVWRVEPHSP